MIITDLIEKKKQGNVHTREEINFIIDSYMNGTVSDAQVAAWLTAVCFNGLSVEETGFLTLAFGNSGKIIDYAELNGKIVDKHSTGGVGDKVTITLIPLLAAAGVPVAKLADRGLGQAAGTVDKLESIPGFHSNLTNSEIVNQVNSINVVIASQSDELAPADKKIYRLRNEISALNSDALLASSIISKKIASGTSHIIIDVKYGSGAFMKTAEDALALARLIIEIGKTLNKCITAIVTSMEEPLGRAIGNSIEVIEAIEFLKGNLDSSDLAELTYSIAATFLQEHNLAESYADALTNVKQLVHSGKALDKFKELIIAQGGKADVIENYDNFSLPSFKVECESKKSGYVRHINANSIALAAQELGVICTNGNVDLSAGIYINKKSGEWVNKGELLYTIYSDSEDSTKIAQKYCDEAFSINENKVAQKNLIYKILSTKDEEENVQ